MAFVEMILDYGDMVIANAPVLRMQKAGDHPKVLPKRPIVLGHPFHIRKGGVFKNKRVLGPIVALVVNGRVQSPVLKVIHIPIDHIGVCPLPSGDPMFGFPQNKGVVSGPPVEGIGIIRDQGP